MNTRKSKNLIFAVIVCLVVTLFSSGCSGKQTLLFLNWGEYINDELVEIFEEKYNCNVIVDIADSNELFYAKLKSGTTAYDLCCPADYMVEKMYINGLIQRIDFDKFENWTSFEDKFMDGVLGIEKEMNETMKDLAEELNFEYDYANNEINYYHMPYFWGTFGLMYNKINPFFKDVETYEDGVKVSDEPDGTPDIFQREDAWKVYFFDPNIPAENQLPLDTKVGMYGDSVRFNYGAFTTYYGGTPNLGIHDKLDGATKTNLEMYKEVLSRRPYKEWGGDSLKHGIESHNIDIAFAYTGDCIDMVYMKIKEDGIDFKDVEFYTYTPEITPAHVDTLVIPSNSRHVDLAHKFLDFLLDPDYAWVNTRDVGYCPPLKEVYNMIAEQRGPSKTSYAVEPDEEELHWRRNWAEALTTTFPIDEEGKSLKKGIPYSYFENEDIKILTNVMNNIIAGK